MNHRAVENLFLDLLEGTLSPELKSEVTAHLSNCEGCRESFAQYRSLVKLEEGLLGSTVKVSAGFSTEVMDMIDKKEEASRGWFGIRVSRMYFSTAATLVTAGIALVLVNQPGVNLDISQSNRPLLDKPLEQPVESDVSTSSSDTPKLASVYKESQSNATEQLASIDQTQGQLIEGANKPATIVTGTLDALVDKAELVQKSLNQIGIQSKPDVNASGDSLVRWGGDEKGKQSQDNLSGYKKDFIENLSAIGEDGQSRGGRPSFLPNGGGASKLLSLEADRIRISQNSGIAANNSVAPTYSNNSATGGQASTYSKDNAEALYRRPYDYPIPVEDYYDRNVARWYQPPLKPLTGETYGHYEENPRLLVSAEPLSTFSIDVDNGSYTNIRRFLKLGQLPPSESVRTEECINYFNYNYPQEREKPFGVNFEVGPSPLDSGRYLLKVGIKAKDSQLNEDRGWNLVFLIDVSGSMADSNKLELIKQSLKVVAGRMRTIDRVAIVTYAGDSRVALESTSGADRERIISAIERLSAGGSTNGSAGIDMAYSIAQANRRSDGVNRVILATDGDFNVGSYDFPSLLRLIEEKRRSGISLTTIGVGSGNLNEQNLEQLANKGNGNYFYFDSFEEARRILETRLISTIETVAKDVKLQMEFNPAQVKEYRLIGFDNRKLANVDFKNDSVDAGEVGSGHTVTALYELVLTHSPLASAIGEELRYQKAQPATTPDVPAQLSGELGFLKIRFKEPNADVSREVQYQILAGEVKSEVSKTSDDFRFAAAVGYFGHLLRNSAYKGSYSFDQIKTLASGAKGSDLNGERQEFIGLVENAAALSRPRDFYPR